MIKEISCEQLKQALEKQEPIVLLDVRSPEEYAAHHLPGCILIPLQWLPYNVKALNPETRYVIYCKIGARSAQAVAFLQSQGFNDVENLQGGIVAWENG